MKTKMLARSLTLALLTVGASGVALAGQMPMDPMPTTAPMADPAASVMVGGAAMLPSKTIVQNASESQDHTTLVAAVKAAGLVDTLSSAGPFTVFAPTNAAFSALPAGTIENLLKPENKAALSAILTYHVVAGKLTVAELEAVAARNDGVVNVQTVQGKELKIAGANGVWTVTGEQGQVGTITIADVNQSNGVIHVIDAVLLP